MFKGSFYILSNTKRIYFLCISPCRPLAPGWVSGGTSLSLVCSRLMMLSLWPLAGRFPQQSVTCPQFRAELGGRAGVAGGEHHC